MQVEHVVIILVVGVLDWIPLKQCYEDLNTREKIHKGGSSVDRTAELQSRKVVIKRNAHGFCSMRELHDKAVRQTDSN